jgi:hypothetical protein
MFSPSAVILRSEEGNVMGQLQIFCGLRRVEVNDFRGSVQGLSDQAIWLFRRPGDEGKGR